MLEEKGKGERGKGETLNKPRIEKGDFHNAKKYNPYVRRLG